MQSKKDIKRDKTELAEKDGQIKKLQNEVEELDNKWKRALADYQNLEKRIREEKVEFVRFAASNLIEKLLGIIDDLEKAQAHLKDEGLGLTLKKLQDLLQAEGVERMETIGKEFDISQMEAIVQVEGDTDNKVVEELRPGYLMHGAVIRPAQVAVSKKLT